MKKADENFTRGPAPQNQIVNVLELENYLIKTDFKGNMELLYEET